MHWRVLALRLLDCFTDDRLKFEQLHLRLRKFFSASSILLDPHQPQPLFQYPNPQLRVQLLNFRTGTSLGRWQLCSRGHPDTTTQTPPVEQVCWSDAYKLERDPS